LKEGIEKTTDELFQEILKYKSYIHYSHGGVTFTGGEPLLQAHAVKDLILKCRAAGIHTAIDTSGFPEGPEVYECLTLADLILLDIKSADATIYHQLTQGELNRTLEKLEFLEKNYRQKNSEAKTGVSAETSEWRTKVWIRYVLVPKWTDKTEHIVALAKLLQGHQCVEKIQVLPLHHMGEYKWEQLGRVYPLKGTPVPTKEEVEKVHQIFKEYHLISE